MYRNAPEYQESAKYADGSRIHHWSRMWQLVDIQGTTMVNIHSVINSMQRNRQLGKLSKHNKINKDNKISP